MTEENKDINVGEIKLQLNGTTKITSIKTRTGESSVLTINQTKMQLSLNTIYKFPIENSELSLTESNCVSPIGSINEKFQILNVENGIVTIMPNFHGVWVESGMVLGKLI